MASLKFFEQMYQNQQLLTYEEKSLIMGSIKQIHSWR